MSATPTQTVRRNWRLPLYAALIAVPIFIVIAALQTDLALILYLLVVAPLLLAASALLLTYAFRRGCRHRAPVLTTLAVLWAISAGFFLVHVKRPLAIRDSIRWSLWAHKYKSQVLAQPLTANGEFKHIEWDGWGWGGIDTTVFLVYDPTDSLSAAARIGQAGKFSGIPCEVPRVSRLESHWYTVLFYTDQYWGPCG
jgi:hypothetical protein